MGDRATIYTYATVYVSSDSFKDLVPYVVAIVDDGQRKVFTRLEDYKEGREISIGMEVEFVKFDERGVPIYRFI